MTTNSKKTARSGKTKAAAAMQAGASDTTDVGASEPPTKLSILIDLLSREAGASVAEMAGATGWQAHSVRGALAGTLRKKGHVVASEQIGGVRRCRIGGAA